MVHLVNEIFKEFTTAKKKEEKIEVLRKYGTHNFKELLNYAFNPKIKFDVAGIPTYKPSVLPAGLNDLYLLHQVVSKLYMFIPVHKKYAGKLPAKKEQTILANKLEALHAEEAKILVDVITKKLKVDGLTPKLIKEAFPDMPF